MPRYLDRGSRVAYRDRLLRSSKMPGETSMSVRSVGLESRQSSLRSCGAQPDIQSEPFGSCLYPSNPHYECGVTQDIAPAMAVFPVPALPELRSPGARSVGSCESLDRRETTTGYCAGAIGLVVAAHRERNQSSARDSLAFLKTAGITGCGRA
jgi:hypothetical protein